MYGRSAELSGNTGAIPTYPDYPESDGPTTSSIPISSPTAAAWTKAGGWVGLVATRRGSTHAHGTPNQDAALVARIVSPTATAVAPATGGLVAAVADGHGGRQHVRSDLGARIAVELAVHMVLDRGPEITGVIVPLIDRWRGEVRQHAALNPFTKAEKASAGIDLDRDPVAAYGATLLIAIASGDDVQLAQLGDGDVVVLGPDGPARPIPADHRPEEHGTSSLCLRNAVADVRLARPPGSRLVLLATDGLGNSQRHSQQHTQHTQHTQQANWWSGLAEDYEKLAAEGLDQLAEKLPLLLAQAAEAGGDDTTVALLLRDPQ